MTQKAPVQQRYEIARSTVAIDRLMQHFIKVGGISIVTAVFGIFIFIVWQIFPLFQGAHVTPKHAVAVPDGQAIVLGADEWTELPFIARADGSFCFLDASGAREPDIRPSPLP